MSENKTDVSKHSIETSLIVIITKNYYLFRGLKALIDSMMPKFLMETSRLYDVIHAQNDSSLNANALQKGRGHILISDSDPRLCAISKGKYPDDLIRLFDGIMIFKANESTEEKNVVTLSLLSGISHVRRCLLSTVKRTVPDPEAPESASRLEQIFTLDEALLLNLVIKGFQPEMIARILNIGLKQVYARRTRLYRKVGVKSLQELYNQINCM